MRKGDILTVILRNFGEKYIEVDTDYDVERIKRRKERLIEKVINRIFVEH